MYKGLKIRNSIQLLLDIM